MAGPNDPISAEIVPLNDPRYASAVQRAGEDPLKDPRKRYVAKLIAMGYSTAAAASKARIKEWTVRTWRKDKLFQWEVMREEAELNEIAARSTTALIPTLIATGAQALHDKDVGNRLRAVDVLRKLHQALHPAAAVQMQVQNNTQVNVHLAPGEDAPTEEKPPVRGIREFIAEDLGRDENEYFPRIMWLLEQIEREDVREVLLMLGKGSGKSYLCSTVLARGAQKILAHPDPARRFGQASGQLVGVINLSVTQTQAQLAIFRTFSQMVEASPWFQRWAPSEGTSTLLRFPKHVIAFCGNSSSRGVEGLNWIYGVADEVCHLPEADDRPADAPTQADNLVNPVRATMLTRFPKDRKLVLVSWPEHQKDYMHKQIEAALKSGVAQDLTGHFDAVPITHGAPADEAAYRALWQQEPFRKYTASVVLTGNGTLIVRAPSWLISPRMDAPFLRQEWERKEYEFTCYYAAAPDRQGSNPFFRDPDAFERRANAARAHPMTPDGKFVEDFKGSGEYLYYAHLDIGVKHDAAGFAVCHYHEGMCIYDLLLEVKPPLGGELRIKALLHVFSDLAARGFTFGKVTVDGFQGIASSQDLEDMGFATEIFSVDKNKAPYDTFKEAWYDGKLDYYAYKPLFECVRDLVDEGKKVEHVDGGKKDVTDAAAAAVWHAFEAHKR